MLACLSVRQGGIHTVNCIYLFRLLRRPPRQAAFLILLVLLSLPLVGCNEKIEVKQAAPVEVGVVTLHPQSVALPTELSGRTTASLVAEVRPQVEGIIRERLFKEGSEVKKGDVLYRIAPESYKAAYDSAVAAQEEAEAVLPSSERKAKRYAKLFQSKAISDQDYEDAQSTYLADKAAVDVAKANVETAKINLGYTQISAPISGRIDKSELTPGALVTASQDTALTTIRCLDPINVDLTQSSISFLNLRQAINAGRISSQGNTISVELKLENGTMYPLKGKLEFSEANVDESTGTYTVRAVFPNPDRLLLPGMYVRAVIKQGVMDNCFLLPQSAVSRNTKGDPVALFVDKDGKVAQRELEVPQSMGNFWLVSSGVNDGDQVIVEGSQFVSDGQKVATKQMEVLKTTGEIRAKSESADSGESGAAQKVSKEG